MFCLADFLHTYRYLHRGDCTLHATTGMRVGLHRARERGREGGREGGREEGGRGSSLGTR